MSVATRSWIGQSVPRLGDEALLAGRAQFVADLAVDDPLRVVLVRSALPHARITAMDRATASRVPGVVCVLVAEDLPADAAIRNDRLTGVRPTIPPLAADIVRSIGEPVAAVVATELAVAEDPAELIRVDYDPLEPVGTLERHPRGDT